MKRKDDSFDLGPHWHLDCRLSSELPEDNVVRVRFLADAFFGSVAVGLVVGVVWLAYLGNALNGDIRDLERRNAEIEAEAAELTRLQAEIESLGLRIAAADSLVGSPYLTTNLWLEIGRTRPEQMRVDMIDGSEKIVVIRGSLNETSERASRLLGRYVDTLRADATIGPAFKEITLTSLDRVENSADLLNFEITMRKE